MTSGVEGLEVDSDFINSIIAANISFITMQNHAWFMFLLSSTLSHFFVWTSVNNVGILHSIGIKSFTLKKTVGTLRQSSHWGVADVLALPVFRFSNVGDFKLGILFCIDLLQAPQHPTSLWLLPWFISCVSHPWVCAQRWTVRWAAALWKLSWGQKCHSKSANFSLSAI